MNTGQLPLSIRLRDTSVVASYFAGRNRSVVEALKAAGFAVAGPTCIWLHGVAGVGKTHLLQAMCAAAPDLGARTAAYLPLRDAVQLGEELLSGYGQLGLVGVDDIDAIAGRGEWERALFRLHQELYEQGGRVVVAAGSPPAALPFKLPDLASRLNGGLVLTLYPLDDEERLAALQPRAQLRVLVLPVETAVYLLRRLPRNMSSLCAFLDELDEASLVAQRRLTVPFVKAVMRRGGEESGEPRE